MDLFAERPPESFFRRAVRHSPPVLAVLAAVGGLSYGVKACQDQSLESIRNNLDKAAQTIPGYNHIEKVDPYPQRMKAGDNPGKAVLVLDDGRTCTISLELTNGGGMFDYPVDITDSSDCR